MKLKIGSALHSMNWGNKCWRNVNNMCCMKLLSQKNIYSKSHNEVHYIIDTFFPANMYLECIMQLHSIPGSWKAEKNRREIKFGLQYKMLWNAKLNLHKCFAAQSSVGQNVLWENLRDVKNVRSYENDLSSSGNNMVGRLYISTV